MILPFARTRGPILPEKTLIAQAGGDAGSLESDRLVETLREQVGGLPLTFLIHGWGTESADEFRSLFPSATLGDACWLIPGAVTAFSGALPSREGEVLLDFSRDVDLRLYKNLVADIVFFPAADGSEPALAESWQARSRVLVIDLRGSLAEATCNLLSDTRAAVLLWPGGDSRELCPRGRDKGASLGSDHGDLTSLGPRLQEEVVRLDGQPDRRARFRRLLEDMRPASPDSSSWDEDLVHLAHSMGWPPWAVQCLPCLYVSLAPSPTGDRHVLGWRSILDCLPTSNYEVAHALCSGQILEVTLGPDADRFAAAIARAFSENLRTNPFSSDRAFVGVIAHALHEMELKLESGESDLGERLKKTRTRILAESRVV